MIVYCYNCFSTGWSGYQSAWAALKIVFPQLSHFLIQLVCLNPPRLKLLYTISLMQIEMLAGSD